MSSSISTQEHFNSLLRKFDTALLVTQSDQQQLRCRPMTIADVESDSDLWFVTSLDASKVSEIMAHPQVCVAMQQGKTCLSLTGRASVVHDRAKIRELWKDAWKVWFPDGQTDSSIALIYVDAVEGEYWDTSGLNGLKYLFKAGKAYLAGERMESDSSINAKVGL